MIKFKKKTEAATAIMNFLSHQGHNLLITQTATPLLKLLSTVDNLELFEGLDSEIKEMIATIAPNPAFIRSNAIESLELLTNFALIESAFDLIISNNVIEEVLNLITFELSQDESVLLEKGELSNNDRVISSAMGFINLLLNSTKTSISIESKMKIQENLLIIIKKQGYIPNQFKQAIIASNLLSKCKETEEIFISECLKSQFLDKLIDGLDQYKDNSEITQEINGILLDFTRKSSQIAEILSEKDFLKILLKETKILFKNFLNNENSEILDRLKGNLDCLKIFSLLGELTTKRLHEINCPELCYNMFHKGIEKKEEEAKAFQIQKCYSKKVRLLFYENEEISGSLVVLFPEILGLLITLTIFNDKSFEFTKEILGDLLKTIELCYKNKGILLLALELLIKLIKTDLKKNLESNCLELFSIPLNYYPLDEEVLIMIGNLFFIINPQLVQEKLNAYQLKPNFDDETTLQLANSLVIYMNRDRKIVETEEQISKNKEIISVFEENMPKNFESFCICVLFFNRMCFHNDLFIEILLKSKVPLQIIETNLEISKINPEVLEISLYTLNKIFKIPSKLSQKIDKLTLDYEEMKTSSIMTQTLSDIYMENKGRHLKDLVVWIEKKEEGYISINHLAIELLFNCTYLYPAIAAYLDENYNLSKIQELYEDICKRNKNLTSNSLVMKLCKLICAMTHIHSCFEGVLKQTSFLQILIDSIQNLQVSETISKEDCRFLEEFLWCLGCFTDNNFDKAEIIEKKVIGVLFQKLNSFGNISFGKIYCIDHIGTALVQTLKTLKILVKNPAIIRITCSDDKSIKILQDSLNNMRENESGSENYDFQGVLEELKIDSIESSENLNEKIIENMMNLLLELTINPLILENFDFLEGVILNHIMFLIKKYKSNLIIAVRGVKFIENSIKSLIEKEILKNKLEHPKIKEIQEFIGFSK